MRVLTFLGILMVSAKGWAQTPPPPPLNEQVESLKQALVNLNRDLFVLEEDILFPTSTELAVYLSMETGEYFQLDAVELQLDGKALTHYLYTERQVDALQRGGIQRLHMTNITQGTHELTAFFIGKGPENRDFKRAVSLRFEKTDEACAVELQIVADTASQQPAFYAVEWQQ